MAQRPSDEPPPDLIRRAQAGDEQAFAELLTPFRSRLFALFRYELRNHADAEDLMQEVLFHAWRGLSAYEHRGRFAAWLFTIAYRDLQSGHRARRTREPILAAAELGEHPSGVGADAELAATELHGVLSSAIGALSPNQRAVVLLRQQSDLTFAQIAEVTGQPLPTVLSHMHRALKQLRHAMRDHA